MPLPAILAALGAGFNMVEKLMAMSPPLARVNVHGQNAIFPNAQPDVMFLIQMYQRGHIRDIDYYSLMRNWGYERKYAEKMFVSRQELPGILDYVRLLWRNEITKEEFYVRVNNLGWNNVDADELLKSVEYSPGPSDIVRFAVREVYTPDIVDQYGLTEDIPKRFLSECLKTGMTQEQATNYWASHWQLPSLTMGYEMYHRGIITADQLITLMKSQDVMPFWRDKLIQLSYNPLTRVDVRRAYSVGALGPEDLRQSYRNLGYSPKDVEVMTNFTILYENAEVNGISRSNVIDAYKKDIITRDTLAYYLKSFGYNTSIIEFWLAEADYEKTLDYVERVKQTLTDQYLTGEIDIESVQQLLGEYDFPATYITKIVNDILQEQSAKRKLPSKSDLDRWLNLGIVDVEYYHRQLKLQGYKHEDIVNYMTELTMNNEDRKIATLKIETYVEWLKSDVMTVDEFRRVAMVKGISTMDIDRYISSIRRT